MAIFIADGLLAHALTVAVNIQHHEAASGKFLGNAPQGSSVCTSAVGKQNAGQLVGIRNSGRDILVDPNLCAAGVNGQGRHFDFSAVRGDDCSYEAEDKNQRQK